MPPRKRKATCKCEWLEREADDPKSPIEFDAELNEYHIVHGPKNFWMIYYCPFCGGRAPKSLTGRNNRDRLRSIQTPKSRRDRLFHRLTDAERKRLVRLTKDMRTLEDVSLPPIGSRLLSICTFLDTVMPPCHQLASFALVRRP